MKPSQTDKIPTLDLHGYRVDDVYDALERFMRNSGLKSHSKIRIITGRGTGKVRAKALEYLKTAHYQPITENEGSFLVVL